MLSTAILAGFYVFDNLSFAIFAFTQAMGLSIIVFGLVSLAILFVVKLIRAYKFINNDKIFIKVITKFVILNIISLSMTLSVIIIGISWAYNFDEIGHEFSYHFIVLFDAFTNCNENNKHYVIQIDVQSLSVSPLAGIQCTSPSS